MLEEQALDLQDVITHQHKHDRLYGRHREKNRDLGKYVAAAAEVKKLLPFEDLAVPDDLFRTHCKAHEESDDHTHEQVCRNVEVLAKHILTTCVYVGVMIANYERQDECEQWRLEQINYKILGIMKFGQDITHRKKKSLPGPARDVQG